MHPMLLKIIVDLDNEILNYENSQLDYSKEIKENVERISELKRLWHTFSKEKHVVKMTRLVDRLVEKYHADFFYYDLKIMEDYEGRFGWYVGKYGTHFIRLDLETEEKLKLRKSVLSSINKYYGEYQIYEINPSAGTVIRKKYKELEFKIITPNG